MVITSYIALKQKIEIFCNKHLQVKKFGGEFSSEINMFATKDEKYPIIFISPISQTIGENTSTFDIDIYCLDRITDDRGNINTIISDTNLILNDFYLYVKNGSDYEIDIIGQPSLTPINNQLLDYAAGWVGRFSLEVDNYCVDMIPFESEQPPVTETFYIITENNDTLSTETGDRLVWM